MTKPRTWLHVVIAGTIACMFVGMAVAAFVWGPWWMALLLPGAFLLTFLFMDGMAWLDSKPLRKRDGPGDV